MHQGKTMNDRIEHCLYQAGLTAQGCWDELDDYAKEAIQKFAKLIIEECHYVTVVGGVDDLDVVLKHFGVEE
jgi:hypothetical protein